MIVLYTPIIVSGRPCDLHHNVVDSLKHTHPTNPPHPDSRTRLFIERSMGIESGTADPLDFPAARANFARLSDIAFNAFCACWFVFFAPVLKYISRLAILITFCCCCYPASPTPTLVLHTQYIVKCLWDYFLRVLKGAVRRAEKRGFGLIACVIATALGEVITGCAVSWCCGCVLWAVWRGVWGCCGVCGPGCVWCGRGGVW